MATLDGTDCGGCGTYRGTLEGGGGGGGISGPFMREITVGSKLSLREGAWIIIGVLRVQHLLLWVVIRRCRYHSGSVFDKLGGVEGA